MGLGARLAMFTTAGPFHLILPVLDSRNSLVAFSSAKMLTLFEKILGEDEEDGKDLTEE